MHQILPSLRLFPVVLAAGLLLTCQAIPASPAGKSAAGGGPRLLIIGVDGLEPRLVEEFSQRGLLPTLRQLMLRGSTAKIDCVVGTSSPVVWTTVATGVPPEQHGITDFVHRGEPVTSTLRQRSAFWNILPQHDLTVATVGWMVTWPAEEGSGIIISDRAHWGRFPDKVSPAGIIDPAQYQYPGWPRSLEFVGRFTRYPFDPEFESLPASDPRYATNFLLKRRFIDIYWRDRTYGRISRRILQEHSVDVVASYFQGVDYVSHGFWKYFEPQPYREAGWEIDDEEIRVLEDLIPKYYSFTDRMIGDLVKHAGPDTLVIVLSDHGFGTGLGKYRIKSSDYISGNHRPHGFLLMAGPQIEPQVRQTGTITHFDVLPTILYALGVPQARNLHGLPLFNYFTNDFLRQNPLQFDENEPDEVPEPGAGAVTASEHDEEILQELRSLGYIE